MKSDQPMARLAEHAQSPTEHLHERTTLGGQMKHLTRRRAVTLVATGALVAATAGGAYAAGTSGGSISACVHHNGGGLYQAEGTLGFGIEITANSPGLYDSAGTWAVTAS
jgi:hypothetical protein